MKELASIDWARERPDVVELNKSFSVSEYIDNRAIYKIKLYFLLSRRSERRYKLISVAVLVLSALVPVVLNSSFLGLESGRMFLASIFSFGVVALFSLESVYGFREQWKGYKTAEDEITAELNLFQLRAEPYGAGCTDPEKLLVMRVEGIILKERKDTLEKLTARIRELDKLGQGK